MEVLVILLLICIVICFDNYFEEKRNDANNQKEQ